MSTNRLQQVRTLYKAILRLHRGLPEEIRPLGDQYVKDEFKRHKKCNDSEANLFLNEWIDYAFQLSHQLGIKSLRSNTHGGKIGNDLDPHVLEAMRDEQVAQLYELMKAAKQECEEKG